MKGALKENSASFAGDLRVVEAIMMASTLDKHVKTPPTSKCAHSEKQDAIDPADLFEYVGES